MVRISWSTSHFFLLDAAWVRSRAERPSVSYTKVTSKVAWTSHNLQVTNKFKQQNCGSNKFQKKGGGRKDETDARAEHQTHWRGASNEWMSGVQHRMPCRASNSLARCIERVESNLCGSPPTRRTRSTGQMKGGMSGKQNQQVT